MRPDSSSHSGFRLPGTVRAGTVRAGTVHPGTARAASGRQSRA